MATDYLLTGATGLVGGEILKQITASQKSRNIFILGRRAPEIQSEKICFVSWDFSSPLQWGSKKPQDAIAICTLGTTMKIAKSQDAFRKVDFDFTIRFAEEAKDLNVASLHIVTAHGASAKSRIFYNRIKGEVEEKLKSMEFPSLHIYRPSLLIGERKEHRSGESKALFTLKLLSPLFKLPGLNTVQPTPADKLASYILDRADKAQSGNHIHSNYEIMRAK